MLDTTLPIELTHPAVLFSKDGRKWKAGIYASNIVPQELAQAHYGKNLDPNAKHDYAKPPVLGEEEKIEPELKLETVKVEDKSVATKSVTTPVAATPSATAPTVVPAPPSA